MILQSEMICLQDSPVSFETTFSSDVSTASTFVTQVEEEESFQPVAICMQVENFSMDGTDGQVFELCPASAPVQSPSAPDLSVSGFCASTTKEQTRPRPVPRPQRSDSARRFPSKFV